MYNDFYGWQYSNEVYIVLRYDVNMDNNDIPFGVIVPAGNKKELERIVQWGTQYIFENNDTGPSVKIERIIEPEVIKIKNHNFKITITDKAATVHVGVCKHGVMCVVEHTELPTKFNTGMETEAIKPLFLQSTFEFGKCMQDVQFAKQFGKLYAVHTGMKEYDNMVSDTETRSKNNKHKTDKWIIGKAYSTLTKTDIYFGEFYSPFNIYGEYDSQSESIVYSASLEKKPLFNVLYDYYLLEKLGLNKSTIKFSELMKELTMQITQGFVNLDNKCVNSIKTQSNVTQTIKIDIIPYEVFGCTSFVSARQNMNKLPKRACNPNIEIEIDIEPNNAIWELIETIQSQVIEIYEKYSKLGVQFNLYSLQQFLLRGHEFDGILTEKETKLLGYMGISKETIMKLWEESNNE